MRGIKAMCPKKGTYMSVKNQMDYDVITRVIRGEITGKKAAGLLGKSYRQTKRIIRKVKLCGMPGLRHGNRDRAPWNKSSVEIKQRVLEIQRSKYFDFNLTHLREKLQTEEGIWVKREVLRTWAHEAHLVKRAHAVRRPKIHRTRHRMPRMGMMLQMDGSHHRWIGKTNPECCLIGGIDDATSICPYAEFFPAEDTLSVLAVLKRTIERVGVPEVLYVDQAAHFGKSNTRSRFVDWQKHLSHVERAMAELGCRVLFAPTPQAKGRIERMWGTFQDRLIPEMRLRNIGRIPTANSFLQEHFIPDFNRRFSKLASEPLSSAYRPIPEHLAGDLDRVFCIQEWRKVSPGETISWNAQTYSVRHHFRNSIRGLQIEIRTGLDTKWRAFYANQPVTLELLAPEVKKLAA